MSLEQTSSVLVGVLVSQSMAAVSQPEYTSELVTSSPRKENELFMPRETPDQRCDVILVVEDAKEFKAHKQVLSEASPFFEKLLNSDMKESREGIVRLEMFSESAMRNTLQFIYTSDVQILAEDNARDLVVSADYFFLPNLKTLAEAAMIQMLTVSNCVSVYYFSQRYQCEELLAKSVNYIFANFTAVYETNREVVINMSSKEMEMGLSSDEINVSAEEDVFKIILTWIDHDRNKRQKYFAELFRHVRLVFASRDFLSSDIVMNDLVKDNESCMNRVVDAINLIDSQNYRNLSISPRKSVEACVIVVTSLPILCYFPGEGRWCKLGEMPREYSGKGEFVCYRGKLYSKVLNSCCLWYELTCYNPYSNCWTRVPYPECDRWPLREIFVSNDNEMYALVSEIHIQAGENRSHRWSRDVNNVDEKCMSSIRKYKMESNSWEDVTSFDHLDRRNYFCIVAKDDFVYFIGGEERLKRNGKVLLKWCTDVNRYNFRRNQWDKVADIQQPKKFLSGVACNGRIFITGKVDPGHHGRFHCEVYCETTNEWQSIASLNIRPGVRPKLLSVDDQLYVLASYVSMSKFEASDTRVECYDADKSEWVLKTEIPLRSHSNIKRVVNCYSARICKSFLSNHQLKSQNPRRFYRPVLSTEASEGKCVIM